MISLEHYDFYFVKNGPINKSLFNYLCYYDYDILVKILLSELPNDTKISVVLITYFSCNFNIFEYYLLTFFE